MDEQLLKKINAYFSALETFSGDIQHAIDMMDDVPKQFAVSLNFDTGNAERLAKVLAARAADDGLNQAATIEKILQVFSSEAANAKAAEKTGDLMKLTNKFANAIVDLTDGILNDIWGEEEEDLASLHKEKED